MTGGLPEGPLMMALGALAMAALVFAARSFHLLYRDMRPKRGGRHRRRHVSATRRQQAA